MVKSAGEGNCGKSRCSDAEFFTYTIKYALPVLLPIFALITFLFFWR